MDEITEIKAVLVSKLLEYTQLNEDEINALLDCIPIEIVSKGTVLLQQGNAPRVSYYLIKGCIRQYASDENGKEITVNFFTEEESINMFSFLDNDGQSLYSLECLEGCAFVECPDVLSELAKDEYPEISNMKRLFFEKQFSELQINYTNYKLKTPAERFSLFIKNRPDLLSRVPQIYLASYLGITPESFSRYKRKQSIKKDIILAQRETLLL